MNIASMWHPNWQFEHEWWNEIKSSESSRLELCRAFWGLPSVPSFWQMYVLLMHHLGHINKFYLRTQISKDVSWCRYVCDCLCLPEQHQVVLLVHDDGAWGGLLALEGGGAQKGLSAMPHSWAKIAKNLKKSNFINSLNWRVILIPATVWYILNMKLMNDRKRKSSISAETCLKKFLKTHQI